MVRLGVALIVLGGMGAYYGYEEYSVGSAASDVPVAVELSALEAGEAPDNHITVGSHWAIYPTAVGWGEQDSDQLDYLYYPVVSESHPYNKAVDAVVAKYQGEAIPEEEQPSLGSLGLLVKTKRFDAMSDVPEQWGEEASVTGLLIHDIEGLKSGEKEILAEAYPDLVLDDVMILEEGREPSSATTALLIMLGGLGGALGGLVLSLRGLFSS